MPNAVASTASTSRVPQSAMSPFGEPCDLAKHLGGVAAVVVRIARAICCDLADGMLVVIRFQRPGCCGAKTTISAPGLIELARRDGSSRPESRPRQIFALVSGSNFRIL